MITAILSVAIFLVCLGFFLTERVDRTIVALLGSILMVLLGIASGIFTETQAIQAIDFRTIFLLLAMMILVALLEPTGFFQFLAVKVGVLSQGKPIRLLIFIGAATFVVSMILNSITAVVLIAPVTILICELLDLNVQPFLFSEIFLANLGGTSTLVGSAPNILIGSAAHFTFVDFLTHSFPIILIAAAGCTVLFIFYFRKDLHRSPKKVRALRQLNPREALHDPKSAIIILGVIAFTILLFLASDMLNISPALAAFIGVGLALGILRPSVPGILKGVQWEILVFFSALFILVGGMDAAGVFREITRWVLLLNNLSPMLMGLIFLWLSALLSAVVENIPIAIAFIPVIQGLNQAGLNVVPIWWAVILGTGLGGNGTIVGSAVNIVVAGLSTKSRHPITSRLWNQRALPITLAGLIIASGLFVLYFSIFGN